MTHVIATGPTPPRPNPLAGVFDEAAGVVAQGVFPGPPDLGAAAFDKVFTYMQTNGVGPEEAILGAGLSQPETRALLASPSLAKLVELFGSETTTVAPGTALVETAPGRKPKQVFKAEPKPKFNLVATVQKGVSGMGIFEEGSAEVKGFIPGVQASEEVETVTEALKDGTEITRYFKKSEFLEKGKGAEEFASFTTKQAEEAFDLHYFVNDQGDQVVARVNKKTGAMEGAPISLGKTAASGGSTDAFERGLKRAKEAGYTDEQIAALERGRLEVQTQASGEFVIISPDGTVTTGRTRNPEDIATFAESQRLGTGRAAVKLAAEKDMRDTTVALAALAELLRIGKELPTGSFGARGRGALFASGIVGQFAPEAATALSQAISGGADEDALIPLMQNSAIVAIENIRIFTGEQSDRISNEERRVSEELSRLSSQIGNKTQFLAAAQNILMFRLLSADRFRIEAGLEAALDLDEREDVGKFLDLMEERYGLDLQNAKNLVIQLRKVRIELSERGKALF